MHAQTREEIFLVVNGICVSSTTGHEDLRGVVISHGLNTANAKIDLSQYSKRIGAPFPVVPGIYKFRSPSQAHSKITVADSNKGAY